MGGLPRRVAWRERRDLIRERLPGVVDDDDLRVIMERTIERYEAVAVGAGDCVLVDGDVGLHNLALDPGTDTVDGIFDYNGAARADRHHDFRYLLFTWRSGLAFLRTRSHAGGRLPKTFAGSERLSRSSPEGSVVLPCSAELIACSAALSPCSVA